MKPQVMQILDMNAFDHAGLIDADADDLLSRRRRNFGPISVLFYRDPIEMVRGDGVWMEAADGRRYLDFYNNVPSVGHCHPKVAQAIADQVATLNINTRYLNERVESYLERLKATLPDPLENVALCCTGSEANDLAMRVAMAATGGRGFIVSEAAYHGNTAAVTEISPSALKRRAPPDYVAVVPPPGRRAFGDDIAGGFAAAVAEAADGLKARGFPLAALICDSIFSSDGVYADPAGYLAPAVAVARAAGGLFIADEVQPGFGRTGAMWGFERHRVTPDVVTMGKPMGNGFPMAGMATRPEWLAKFVDDIGYFNTFGGNPVAAAAGAAVLDVIEEDDLLANARVVGAYLLDRLETLKTRHASLVEARGAGLFLGIELCRDGDLGQPDAKVTVRTIDGLRDRGVLIGAAGRYGNILKVRPPLRLAREEADQFVSALDAALGEATAS
ncbi:MAG: aspartate aminotransferase family protein [Pseudomonadota bacterium]